MATSTSSSHTLPLDTDLIDRLRDDLSAADWTVEVVGSLLSPMARTAMERDQLVPASVELHGITTPAATLTRLFILAEEVNADEVARALPSLSVAGAVRLGLVQRVGSQEFRPDFSESSAASTLPSSEPRAGETRLVSEDARTPSVPDTVRAIMDLRPHAAQLPDGEGFTEHHWWVASDLSQAQTGNPPQEDYVLGIASASTNLLRLTMRAPVGSALDLGCGCGILALYLSTHSKRVVATDISERACNVTRFNALLNRVQIDVRQGSLFEPVKGETFDLITSNPPFVITPEAVRASANLEYRDGGMERDSLTPLIIKQSVGHLNPGGTLQMLANWEVSGEEETWALRPTMWIEAAAEPALDRGLSVNAWLVQRDLVDVSQYAEWWIRDAKGDQVGLGEWNEEYREWLRDFAEAGTKYVGLGFLAFHIEANTSRNLKQVSATNASAQEPRIRDEFDHPDRTGESLAPDISDEPRTDRAEPHPTAARLNLVSEYVPDGLPADGAAVQTALENLVVPQNWASLPLVRAEDVREVRYFVPGSTDPELVRITQGSAGGRDRTVRSSVAALIGVSDGELTPAQVIPAIAMLLGREENTVRDEIDSALPELLRSGVLRTSSK